MGCEFERKDGLMVCGKCGRRMRIFDDSLPPERYHASCMLDPPPIDELADPTLLGNRMQTWFSAIGITKEWFAEMTGEIGEPGCVGCDKRQEYVNKAHRWLRKKLYGV